MGGTAAQVRLKPGGGASKGCESGGGGAELVVEHLWPALLRCQPGADFMQENADVFRWERGGRGGGGGVELWNVLCHPVAAACPLHPGCSLAAADLA